MEHPTFEHRIVTSIFAVTRALAAQIRQAGAHVQLTVPQFNTLRLLEEGDLSVGELAKRMHVAMPTATQSMDSLTSKGFVERYTDEKDRRQVGLRVTNEGRALLDSVYQSVERYLTDTLGGWPQKRREGLAATLEDIQEAIRERHSPQTGIAPAPAPGEVRPPG